MTNKTLITLHAAIYAVFALVLFFLPDLMWPSYGIEISDQNARFLSQHTSIFLGGIALFCWLLRDGDDPTSRKVLTALLWTNVLGVVVTLYACVTGIFSGFGWSDPVFFAVMAALCFAQLRRGQF